MGIELLTAKDLAGILRISPKTVANKLTVAPHELPPRLPIPGRRPRWRLQDVDSWMAKYAQAGVAKGRI